MGVDWVCLSLCVFFVVVFAGISCIVCSGVLNVWGVLWSSWEASSVEWCPSLCGVASSRDGGSY